MPVAVKTNRLSGVTLPDGARVAVLAIALVP
jgi:hypothetical protein